MDASVVGQQPGGWTCPTCGRACPSDFAVCPHDATPRTDHAASGDPMIGEVLGRTYRIIRAIGQGGMAKLYEAEHLRIDAHYAIKIIHDDLAREPDMLVRFEREARAAGKIHSDHVVRLVDVLRTADHRPCLVTELLEGEDLQARLDRAGRMSVAEAIPIARQLCRAVADAHAVGVVHRDLKPSNVFLCTGEAGLVVKVFDFGVAKLDGDERMTRTDAVMGTAAYMAPEQARSAVDAGPLADVYSIGAVLYHMLCGVPPYGDAPAFSRFALVLHEEPARPRTINPAIPAGVEAVIQLAMARDRTLRARSPLELEVQLEAFDTAEPSDLSEPIASPVVEPAPVERADAIPEVTPTANTEKASIPPVTPPAPVDKKPRPTLATQKQLRQTQPHAVAAAVEITLRAKLARPIAGFVAVASSLAAGAWIAAILAALIRPASTGERALIALIGIGAIAAVAVLHVRTLRPRWSSTPSIARHTQPFARALYAGITTLGALELAVHATTSLADGVLLAPAVRLAIAGIAAGLGLGSRRFGFDTWLRNKIG